MNKSGSLSFLCRTGRAEKFATKSFYFNLNFCFFFFSEIIVTLFMGGGITCISSGDCGAFSYLYCAPARRTNLGGVPSRSVLPPSSSVVSGTASQVD